MTDEKIISKEEFFKRRQAFRDEGKKVVLCHGVFDLLHYGHIEHLEEAKKQGDILVVSVTAAQYVNKGPGRPYFDDRQRMSFLASLSIVDYVLLSEAVTVQEIVSFVQPDIYAKGQEYARAADDVTGNIGPEQAAVEAVAVAPGGGPGGVGARGGGAWRLRSGWRGRGRRPGRG